MRDSLKIMLYLIMSVVILVIVWVIICPILLNGETVLEKVGGFVLLIGTPAIILLASDRFIN
jgi:hypothetical protein